MIMCLLSGMFALTILCCFLTPLPSDSFTPLLALRSFFISAPLRSTLPSCRGSVGRVAGLCVQRIDRPSWLLSSSLLLTMPPSVKLSSDSTSRPCQGHPTGTHAGVCVLCQGDDEFVPLELTKPYHRVTASESFVVCDFRGMCGNIYISQVRGSKCRVKFPFQYSFRCPSEKHLFNTKSLWDKESGTMVLIVTHIFTQIIQGYLKDCLIKLIFKEMQATNDTYLYYVYKLSFCKRLCHFYCQSFEIRNNFLKQRMRVDYAGDKVPFMNHKLSQDPRGDACFLIRSAELIRC